jgi:hypothetical protein
MDGVGVRNAYIFKTGNVQFGKIGVCMRIIIII